MEPEFQRMMIRVNQGKGGKVRTVFFSDECVDVVNHCLDLRADEHRLLGILRPPRTRRAAA